MEEIRDVKKHLACVGDPLTGTLEYEDSKLKWTADLPVGGKMTIERKGAKTTIIRSAPDHFTIERKLQTA